jgi:hypothetical protein
LTGGNAPKLLQSPCRDTKYRPRAFHSLNAFPLRQFSSSNRSPTKWVRFEKEEGDRIVQLLPQGESGTVRASSDALHLTALDLRVIFAF